MKSLSQYSCTCLLSVISCVAACLLLARAGEAQAPVDFPQTPQITLGGSQFSGWTGLKKPSKGIAALAVPSEATFRYPPPPEGKPETEAQRQSRDWFHAYGVRFDVQLPDERPVRLDVRLLAGPNPTASTLVVGKGWHTVSLPWKNFDIRRHFSGFLNNVQGLTITARFDGGGAGHIALRSPQVMRGDQVWLRCNVRGKSVEPGSAAEYSVTVGNPTDAALGVNLSFEKGGYDAMRPTVSPSALLLKAGESRTVMVRVEVPTRIPPGGHETQVLRAVGNGTASPFDKLEFITASRLGYPNIMHTQAGWDEVRAKVQKYDWAKQARDDYVKRADGWNVPSVRNQKDPKPGDWLFVTQVEHDLMTAGIAYQLTGDAKYAEKLKLFLMRLSDPTNGFPVTRRACNQASVQEGHFFQHVAMSYDMTISSGVYSAAERAQIDATLRLFVGPDADPELTTDFQISNWTVSYKVGQLYSALALQDLAAAQRLLYSPMGIIDQLVKGTLDDGWWYELSISYNTWVASEFSQVAIAMQPWGYNLADEQFPANFRSGEETPPEKEEYGMSKAQWGPIHHNTMSIKRMWDLLPRMVDSRGVLFGLNDSTEMRVAGFRGEAHARPLELAYYLYRDPAYATIIKSSGEPRDLIYGVPELPSDTPDLSAQSAYADNAGVAVLRSRTTGRPDRERIQAVLRYGDHGWYHGHFDVGDMVHLSRYGRSFYNPEVIWYGYPNFMYKFYTQTSVAHNMVVVDQKQQEPAPSERVLFYPGQMMQAAAVQVNTRWSNPPYGGMRYGDQPHKTFAEKAFAEGRSVPTPAELSIYDKWNSPTTSLTGYTEPILQRRLMIMTDDYVVLADYLKAEKEHTFDALLQMRSFQGLEAADKKLLRHDGQWNPDPLSSAQFVTDCDWYEVQAPARGSFQFKWGESGDWVGANEPGVLNVDVHALWPKRQELMLGTPPENLGGNRQVTFAVRADGKVLSEGKSGMWILGEKQIDVQLQHVKSLELETQSGGTNPGTLFWANARVLTAEGKEIPLSQLPITFDNAAQTHEKGKDFAGGPIKIAGVPYTEAISAQPQDGKKPCIVRVDLSGMNAVRLQSTLGADFPVGDESQRRKMVALRAVGKEARFVTVLEPFDDKRMVKSAVATDASTLRVELNDGRVQEIQINGLDGDGKNITTSITESRDGKVLRSETTTQR
jgi:hypothetical protein